MRETSLVRTFRTPDAERTLVFEGEVVRLQFPTHDLSGLKVLDAEGRVRGIVFTAGLRAVTLEPETPEEVKAFERAARLVSETETCDLVVLRIA